jgi:4-hydroxy-4-methyl-2-oxoglutarate aldolase
MDIIEEFKKLSTPTVSDAMDKLGVDGTCLGIAPLDFGFRLVGRAFTVKYVPAGVNKGTVGDYIDDINPGEVVVLDNGGRMEATVWGDILTTVADRRGIAGTVIHGVCRDVSKSLELNYPIFSCGNYMRTGKDRVQVEAMNVPVSLGSVRVEPGDLLIGDADGIVVVPKELEQKILEISMEIEEKENKIRDEVQKGIRLDEARKQLGYHLLQRKN